MPPRSTEITDSLVRPVIALVHKINTRAERRVDGEHALLALAGSPTRRAGARVQRIAAAGVLLVVEELRGDVTKTRNDGSRGRLKIDYGDARQRGRKRR